MNTRIERIVLESSNMKSELCILGQAVGTDKSPYNTCAHRHPYTAAYTMLFSPLKNRPIQFAEIGIAAGRSAVLWEMYFANPETRIHMFDRDENFIANADSITGKRVVCGKMDVSMDGDVFRALSEKCDQYDVIIDDSSHEHGHQIRIIKEGLPLLKQGGLLIVEDVFRATPEEEYTRELTDILPRCSAAYFIVCEHKDRWSPGWDNDKLLVLVKA